MLIHILETDPKKALTEDVKSVEEPTPELDLEEQKSAGSQNKRKLQSLFKVYIPV